MIKIKRLDHVQITIPPGAEARARAFYGEVLGLEEIEKPGALKPRGGLWYRVADMQLHIGIEEVVGRSKRHPAFEVEGLDEIRDYLRENGVEIREEIAIPGMSRFSFYTARGAK